MHKKLNQWIYTLNGLVILGINLPSLLQAWDICVNCTRLVA